MRPARLAGLGAVLLVLVAGCGAPTSGRLTIVDPTDQPYATTASSSVAPEPSGPDRATRPRAYFVVGAPGTLRPVRVDVAGLAAPDAARRLLDALAAGPTTQQRDRGLSTAFPPAAVLRLTGLDRGTARIEVRFADAPPATDALPVAVGQLVLTVTSVPGIDGVTLVDGSAALPAPLPGGRLVDRPVTASDYASLLLPTTGPTDSPTQ